MKPDDKDAFEIGLEQLIETYRPANDIELQVQLLWDAQWNYNRLNNSIYEFDGWCYHANQHLFPELASSRNSGIR